MYIVYTFVFMSNKIVSYLILSYTEINYSTKLVKSETKFPYCDRLKMLGLTTLYYRILRADVIQVYIIINKINKLEL